MQDLKYAVESDTINKILQSCYEHDMEIEEFQGTLNDAYIIHNHRTLSIGCDKGRKASGRKYILVVPEYRNEWSDALFVLCTDNEKLVDNYRTIWQATS